MSKSRVTFKLNKKGVAELMKRSEIQQICVGYATRMQQLAGPGYEVETRNYPERSGAALYPGNMRAYNDNLKNNTLEKVRRSV